MSIAWIASVIDWDTCKIQYEVLGDSLERIAAVHNLSVTSIKRVAEEEGWTRVDHNDSSLGGYVSEIIENHKAKLSLAALYREMEMFPVIVATENELLDKISKAIKEIDPADIRAASALRALGQSLNAIADRKMPGIEEGDTDLGDGVWTVEVGKQDAKD